MPGERNQLCRWGGNHRREGPTRREARKRHSRGRELHTQRSCGRKELGVFEGETAESREDGGRWDGMGRGRTTQAWWPRGGACTGSWGQGSATEGSGGEKRDQFTFRRTFSGHRAWHTGVLSRCSQTMASPEGTGETRFRAIMARPGRSTCSLRPVKAVRSRTGRGWCVRRSCPLPGPQASHLLSPASSHGSSLRTPGRGYTDVPHEKLMSFL